MIRKLFTLIALLICGLTAMQGQAPQQPVSPQIKQPLSPEHKTEETADEKKAFHFTFDNVAGALGIVFGVVTLIAYLDQKRTNRQQEPVLGYIKRNMTKDVSEEALAALAKQLKEMQQQTTDEMPKLARRAVLLEQGQRLSDLLAETYTQWKNIESEIGSLMPSKLDPTLEAAITDKMLPSYMLKMKTESNQQKLTIGASAIALCSFILPFPIDTIIGFPLAIWLLPTVIQLLNSAGATEGTRQTVQWVFRVALMVAIISLGIFVYSVFHHGMFNEPSFTLSVLANTAIISGVILVAAAIPLDRLVKRWCQKQLNGTPRLSLVP